MMEGMGKSLEFYFGIIRHVHCAVINTGKAFCGLSSTYGNRNGSVPPPYQMAYMKVTTSFK